MPTEVFTVFIPEMAVRAAERVSEISPGSFLFGNALAADIQNNKTGLHRFYNAVGVLGNLPFVKPDWVDGLTDGIERVLRDFEESDSLNITETAKKLAEGLQTGFMSGLERLTQRAPEQEALFQAQRRIFDRLCEISSPQQG